MISIMADGKRYLLSVVKKGWRWNPIALVACGSCGGHGCQACSEKGWTKETSRDKAGEELLRHYQSYEKAIAIAHFVVESVAADLDIAMLPGSIRGRIAVNVGRGILSKFGQEMFGEVCEVIAEDVFKEAPAEADGLKPELRRGAVRILRNAAKM